MWIGRMPVSEDEFERPAQAGPVQPNLSKAEQRKSNKPIMEKRRRARINHCLNELKTLILDAMKKDPARHSKLEKADILEMTVKHLQQIQRQQLATAVASDPGVITRFKSGFDECATEVNRYIGRLEGVDSGVKQRLTSHLHRCLNGIQHVSAFPHQLFSTLPQNCDKTNYLLPNATSALGTTLGDVNNNDNNQNHGRIQIPNGLHLIPSRLPTGELALLVPNTSHLSALLNTPNGATFQCPQSTSIAINSVMSPPASGTLSSALDHPSAFTSVSKNQDYPSPTSTVDIEKKELESPAPEKLNSLGLNETRLKNSRVAEEKSGNAGHEDKQKKMNFLEKNYSWMEPSQNLGPFQVFPLKPNGGRTDPTRASSIPSSSSFQRSLADSTTSFAQPDTLETGFKPFQVDIPNTHLKAHIAIPEKTKPFFRQKQNTNKHGHKFSITARQQNNFLEIKSETESDKTNKETFSEKIGTCILPKLEPIVSSNGLKPREDTSDEPYDASFEKCAKRPIANDSFDTASAKSSDLPDKVPRISLNVTLTEQRSKDDQCSSDLCKRISVIVEDSPKSNSGNSRGEMTVNVSPQKDMWRPW